MLSEAGDKKIIDFEPDSFHAERVAEHFRAINAVFERDAVEDVAVKEAGGGSFARCFRHFIEIERGYLLVGT